MELEDPTAKVVPPPELPHMPEPPPVRLLAISDVRLAAIAGLERQLDAFYAGLLKFERDGGPDEADGDRHRIIYHAERWRLIFDVVERPASRDDYRPVMVQIPHFGDFIEALAERKTEYEWQKGVAPGVETVFLQDPAGFWVSVGPLRAIA